MDTQEFAQSLAQEGFEPAVSVIREAGGMLADHVHPFEAKALILSGEIRILTTGGERVYRAGEIFHLQAGEPHSEYYGPQGVSYLAGRKRTD